MVAGGTLHASALSLLRKHLTPENAAELFELCKQKSARQAEELLAARFPRPDVRDLVRRLPSQARLTLDVGCSSQRAPGEASRKPQGDASPSTPSAESENASVESLPRKPAAALGLAVQPKSRRLEPLSADRYGVHFTADGEFRALLERVRGLAGHRLPSGDLMTLLKRGLEAYERELEKERFTVGSKPRRSSSAAPASAECDPTAPDLSAPDPKAGDRYPARSPKPILNSKRKRHYPAAVARAVFLRDGKQCSYVAQDGRRCTARRCLELDHVEPWAVGGEATIDNLRLYCRAHNQRYARQYYGKSRVEAAVQHSRWRPADRPAPGES